MILDENQLYTLSNNFNNTTQTKNGTQKTTRRQNQGYTEIFAWGCDNEGQMGLGENKSGKKYSIPRFCSFNVVIQQISCGKNHSSFIAQNGYVYSMGLIQMAIQIKGSNEFGKLGISQQLAIKNAYSPQLVESIQKFKAVSISCGFDHTGVVCATGEIFTWGRNTDGQLGLGNYMNQQTPQQVNFSHIQTINSQIAKFISCGAYHTSVLLEFGEVCSFGQNSQGQLGLGNLNNECQPKMNDNIQEITTMISCGYYHTLFLTKSMKVLACGDNSEGQLGLGNKKGQTKPVLINKLENIQIIAAKQHSAAINLKGELYLFGTCMFGEFLFPQKVHNLKKPMKSISLGDNFGCVIDNEGQLYTWGYNENGQLGLGDYEPRILPTAMVCLKGKKAVKIECGQNYCISLGNTVFQNQQENQKTLKHVQKSRVETHNDSVDDVQNKSVYDIPEQNLIPFFRRNSQNSTQFLNQNKQKQSFMNITSTNSQLNHMTSQNNQDCSFISSPEKSMYQHRIEEMKNVKSIKQQQLDLINNQPVQQNNDFLQQNILISKQLYGNKQQNVSNQFLLPQYTNNINDQSPLNLSAIEQPTYAPTTAFVSQNYAEDEEQQLQLLQQQPKQYDSNQPKNFGQDQISNYKKQFNLINQKLRSKSSQKSIIKDISNINSADTSYLLQQGASQLFSKFNKSFNQDFLENQNQSFENKKHSQSFYEEPDKGEGWNKILQQKEILIKRLKEEIAEIRDDHQQELNFVKQQLEQERTLNQKVKEQVETLKKREIQLTEQINQVQAELNIKIKDNFELQNIITQLEKKTHEQTLTSTKQIEQINIECNNYKKKIKEFELRLLDESSINYQTFKHQIQQKDHQNEQLRNIIQNLEIKNKELEDTLVEFNQTGSQQNFWKGTQQIQNSFQNTQQMKQDRSNKNYFNSSMRKPSNDSSRMISNQNITYTQQFSPYLQHQTSYQNQQSYQNQTNNSYQNQNRCVSPSQYSNKNQNNQSRQPFQQISVNQMKLANIVSRSPIQSKQIAYNQQTNNKSQRDFSNNSSTSYNQPIQEFEQQKHQSKQMLNKFEKSANKILTMLTSESPEKYTFDQNDVQNEFNLEASFKQDQILKQGNEYQNNEIQDTTPKQLQAQQFDQIYRDISNFEIKDNRSKSLEKRMQDFEKRLKESSQKNK